jgi:hypothetical protein
MDSVQWRPYRPRQQSLKLFRQMQPLLLRTSGSAQCEPEPLTTSAAYMQAAFLDLVQLYAPVGAALSILLSQGSQNPVRRRAALLQRTQPLGSMLAGGRCPTGKLLACCATFLSATRRGAFFGIFYTSLSQSGAHHGKFVFPARWTRTCRARWWCQPSWTPGCRNLRAATTWSCFCARRAACSSPACSAAARSSRAALRFSSHYIGLHALLQTVCGPAMPPPMSVAV